jgi:hypothetical protein
VAACSRASTTLAAAETPPVDEVDVGDGVGDGLVDELVGVGVGVGVGVLVGLGDVMVPEVLADGVIGTFDTQSTLMLAPSTIARLEAETTV